MNEELRLSFTALAKPPVGYGYTYACTVQTDSQDDVGPKTFIMTVLLGDKSVLQQLNQASSGHIFKGEFQKYKTHVEYNMMPITGFVDQDRTAWKLSTLE